MAAVGNDVAAEYFHAAELCVALRAGRMKGCTRCAAFPY